MVLPSVQEIYEYLAKDPERVPFTGEKRREALMQLAGQEARQQRNNRRALDLLMEKAAPNQKTTSSLSATPQRDAKHSEEPVEAKRKNKFDLDIIQEFNLDDLQWGQPSRNQGKQMQRPIKTMDLDVSDLALPPFSANDSPEAYQELLEVQELGMLRGDRQDDINSQQTKEGLLKEFKEYAETHHLLTNWDFVRMVMDDVNTIVLSLKFAFNRPRPDTLAQHKGILLSVEGDGTYHTPAYPSFHSTASRLVAEVIAGAYVGHKTELLRIADKIGMNRVIAGYHYMSDHQAGLLLANQLILKITTNLSINPVYEREETIDSKTAEAVTENFMDTLEEVHRRGEAVKKEEDEGDYEDSYMAAVRMAIGRHADETSFMTDVNKAEQDTRRHIFVFGSNLLGIHGKGAAEDAKKYHGAVSYDRTRNIDGVGQGLTGDSYALPTKKVPTASYSNPDSIDYYVREYNKKFPKDRITAKELIDKKHIKQFTLNELQAHVNEFVKFMEENPNMVFHLTDLGTENAGYTVDEMADAFDSALTNSKDSVALYDRVAKGDILLGENLSEELERLAYEDDTQFHFIPDGKKLPEYNEDTFDDYGSRGIIKRGTGRITPSQTEGGELQSDTELAKASVGKLHHNFGYDETSAATPLHEALQSTRRAILAGIRTSTSRAPGTMFGKIKVEDLEEGMIFEIPRVYDSKKREYTEKESKKPIYVKLTGNARLLEDVDPEEHPKTEGWGHGGKANNYKTLKDKGYYKLDFKIVPSDNAVEEIASFRTAWNKVYPNQQISGELPSKIVDDFRKMHADGLENGWNNYNFEPTATTPTSTGDIGKFADKREDGYFNHSFLSNYSENEVGGYVWNAEEGKWEPEMAEAEIDLDALASSNLSAEDVAASVKGKRVVYRTAEQAYQAAKFAPDAVDPKTKRNIREVIRMGTANKARTLAKKLEVNDDLMSIPSSEVVSNDPEGGTPRLARSKQGLALMGNIVQEKIVSDLGLRKLLQKTGTRKLIEGTDDYPKQDRYWGKAGGEGANFLGEILMAVRDRLDSNHEDHIPIEDIESRYNIEEPRKNTSGYAFDLGVGEGSEYEDDAQPTTTPPSVENNVHSRSTDPMLAALSHFTSRANWRYKKENGAEGTDVEYRVTIGDKEYEDLEEYYGDVIGGGNYPGRVNENRKPEYQDDQDPDGEKKMEVMTAANIEKFKQHDALVKFISGNGGLKFIAGLEHYYPPTDGRGGSRRPHDHDPGWEGKGARAWNMQVIGRAYAAVVGENEVSKEDLDTFIAAGKLPGNIKEPTQEELDNEYSNVNRISLDSPTAPTAPTAPTPPLNAEIADKIKDVPDNKMIIDSGLAEGADDFWGFHGEGAGHYVIGHSFEDHIQWYNKGKTHGAEHIHSDEWLSNDEHKEAWAKAREWLYAHGNRSGSKYDTKTGSYTDEPTEMDIKKNPDYGWGSYNQKLISRDYDQVKDVDAVLAMVKGIESYTDAKGTREGAPSGGTAWAVATGIQLGKPVYIYNEQAGGAGTGGGLLGGWQKWNYETKQWDNILAPPYYKRIAGVGSRRVRATSAGDMAIKAYVDGADRWTEEGNSLWNTAVTPELKQDELQHMEDHIDDTKFPNRTSWGEPAKTPALEREIPDHASILPTAPDGKPWNEIEDMPGYYGPKDIAELLRHDPILKAEYDRIHGDDAVNLLRGAASQHQKPIEVEVPSEEEMRKQIDAAVGKVSKLGTDPAEHGEKAATRRKDLAERLKTGDDDDDPTNAEHIQDGLSGEDLTSLWIAIGREGIASERANFMVGLEEIVKDFRSPIENYIDRKKLNDPLAQKIWEVYQDKALSLQEQHEKRSQIEVDYLKSVKGTAAIAAQAVKEWLEAPPYGPRNRINPETGNYENVRPIPKEVTLTGNRTSYTIDSSGATENLIHPPLRYDDDPDEEGMGSFQTWIDENMAKRGEKRFSGVGGYRAADTSGEGIDEKMEGFPGVHRGGGGSSMGGIKGHADTAYLESERDETQPGKTQLTTETIGADDEGEYSATRHLTVLTGWLNKNVPYTSSESLILGKELKFIDKRYGEDKYKNETFHLREVLDYVMGLDSEGRYIGGTGTDDPGTMANAFDALSKIAKAMEGEEADGTGGFFYSEKFTIDDLLAILADYSPDRGKGHIGSSEPGEDAERRAIGPSSPFAQVYEEYERTEKAKGEAMLTGRNAARERREKWEKENYLIVQDKDERLEALKRAAPRAHKWFTGLPENQQDEILESFGRLVRTPEGGKTPTGWNRTGIPGEEWLDPIYYRSMQNQWARMTHAKRLRLLQPWIDDRRSALLALNDKGKTELHRMLGIEFQPVGKDQDILEIALRMETVYKDGKLVKNDDGSTLRRPSKPNLDPSHAYLSWFLHLRDNRDSLQTLAKPNMLNILIDDVAEAHDKAEAARTRLLAGDTLDGEDAEWECKELNLGFKLIETEDGDFDITPFGNIPAQYTRKGIVQSDENYRTIDFLWQRLLQLRDYREGALDTHKNQWGSLTGTKDGKVLEDYKGTGSLSSRNTEFAKQILLRHLGDQYDLTPHGSDAIQRIVEEVYDQYYNVPDRFKPKSLRTTLGGRSASRSEKAIPPILELGEKWEEEHPRQELPLGGMTLPDGMQEEEGGTDLLKAFHGDATSLLSHPRLLQVLATNQRQSFNQAQLLGLDPTSFMVSTLIQKVKDAEKVIRDKANEDYGSEDSFIENQRKAYDELEKPVQAITDALKTYYSAQDPQKRLGEGVSNPSQTAMDEAISNAKVVQRDILESTNDQDKANDAYKGAYKDAIKRYYTTRRGDDSGTQAAAYDAFQEILSVPEQPSSEVVDQITDYVRKVSAVPEVYDHLKGILPEDLRKVMTGVPEEFMGEFPGDETEKDNKVNLELQSLSQLSTIELRGLYHDLQHQFVLNIPIPAGKKIESILASTADIPGWGKPGDFDFLFTIPEQYRLFTGTDIKQLKNTVINYRKAWGSLDSIDQRNLAQTIKEGKIVDTAAFLHPTNDTSLFHIYKHPDVATDRGTRRKMKQGDIEAEIERNHSTDADRQLMIERELAVDDVDSLSDHFSDDYFSESDMERALENHTQNVINNLIRKYENMPDILGKGKQLLNIDDESEKPLDAERTSGDEDTAEGEGDDSGETKPVINMKGTSLTGKAAQERWLKETLLQGSQQISVAQRRDWKRKGMTDEEKRQSYIDEGVKVISLGVGTGADVYIAAYGPTGRLTPKVAAAYTKKLSGDRKEFKNQFRKYVDIEDQRLLLGEVLDAIEGNLIPHIVTKDDGDGGKDVFVEGIPYPTVRPGNYVQTKQNDVQYKTALEHAGDMLSTIVKQDFGGQPELLKRFNALDGSERGGFREQQRENKERVTNYVTKLISEHPVFKSEEFNRSPSNFEAVLEELLEVLSEDGVEHNGETVHWNNIAPRDNPTLDEYVNDYLDGVGNTLESTQQSLARPPASRGVPVVTPYNPEDPATPPGSPESTRLEGTKQVAPRENPPPFRYLQGERNMTRKERDEAKARAYILRAKHSVPTTIPETSGEAPMEATDRSASLTTQPSIPGFGIDPEEN